MIEIENRTKFSVDKRFFEGVAKKVLKGENREMENISIVFVTPVAIKKVNKKYREKDKPTDVLSFEIDSRFKGDVAEVLICPAVVKKNAKTSRVAFKKAMADVLIHGILHTLGYDHEISKAAEEKMFTKQSYYLNTI